MGNDDIKDIRLDEDFTPPTIPENGDDNYSQEQLPNSTAILVLGILSIVTCMCGGITGIILGIIALSLATKANDELAKNPNRYTPASASNTRAGKICAIIGLITSSLYFLAIIIVNILDFNNTFGNF